ncbi:MAG: 4'-phosphopantetheinyl transferase superfamily protein [Gammaproteobacteria bacterium]|nr:4'-phosphopantetheinyl transferase superfamily protein [Gammaproteobacteria bacterium]
MLYCGIDIESLDRAKRLYERGGIPLGLFAACERSNIKDYLSAIYAFTGKEAVLKSLGSGWFNTKIDPHDIRLAFNDKRIPVYVTLYNEALNVFRNRHCQHVSLKYYVHDRNIIAACVMSKVLEKPIKSSIIAVRLTDLAVISISRKKCHSFNKIKYSIATTSPSDIGRAAVNLAVSEIPLSCGFSYCGGHVKSKSNEAPNWNISCLDKSRCNREFAVSITHNKNYACGMALSSEIAQG